MPVYAANIHIKVDGVTIASDVAPETMNNRTMVPLRVISEDLGAKVDWLNSKVTLSKSDMQVLLKLDSATAVKNDKTVLLDAKPYLKNNRMMVPLRFLAETFGCDVNYKNFMVTVATQPLVINGVEVKALQQEYHMTMGGVVQQIEGSAYNKAIYDVILGNKGRRAEMPVKYSWMPDIDTPGAYYTNGQYDFLDPKGKSVQRFDIYSLIEALPAETLAGYPKVLLYDVTANEWYLFSNPALQSIGQIIDLATKNGFLKIISNTIV